MKTNKEIIKEFEKIVGIEDSELMKDYPYTIRKLEELILKALKSQRKEIIEEMIKLSDVIESQYETEFNEWRAFKGFRNEMRDRLKKKS